MSKDFPQPDALISLTEAKAEHRCRICGEFIECPAGPADWKESYGKVICPIRLTLNFGDEFAHTDCLETK